MNDKEDLDQLRPIAQDIPTEENAFHESLRNRSEIWFGCSNFNVQSTSSEVISETALGTVESLLLHCDVRSACIHHTQSHYPDTGPTRFNTKSIMSDTRRISC
ncbi:hypothetical protein ElyMa_004746100 [Elysia marginata]|uniref:Uncharacterized protein n=1 Tax=Elysia marginata TaxID=1093978 RepID=A0AAV4IDR4_9GAST|nr:hypothetical protein ElyMa_004746100 [Elysia marginata]